MLAFIVCALAVALSAVNASRHTYYLPGVAPQTYKSGESVRTIIFFVQL
jgi:hypothetical protein